MVWRLSGKPLGSSSGSRKGILENEKYMQFYKDLQDSPTLELKEIVYKNFYYSDNQKRNNPYNRTAEENLQKFKDMLDSL